MSGNSNTRYTLLIGLLAIFSGAAALSHELLWTRRLIDVLGATDWVIGRVLGLFFLGISIGAYLATIQLRRDAPALKQLMVVELSIAILAIPAAFLPFWTDWIWALLGTEFVVGWQGALAKVLIGIVAVMPPSIAIGYTLPLFIRAATERGNDVASVGIWIYAVNTLGGVLGLWFTSTQLIQWLGASYSMLGIILLNGLIAASIGFMSKSKSHSIRSRNKPRKSKTKKRLAGNTATENDEHAENLDDGGSGLSKTPSWSLLACLSFVSGFIVLSLEILLLRLVYLVVPSSFHSTSALLANVILILAIGSLLISISGQVGRLSKLVASRSFVGICLMGTALFISVCPIVLYHLTDQLISIRYLEGLNNRMIHSVSQYWMLIFWLVASTGGLALLCSSFVFPTLMKLSSITDPDGKNLGLLLCANGVGGILGSEFSNMVLVEWIGVYQSFTFLAAITLLCGSILIFSTQRVWTLAGMLGITAVLFFVHSFSSSLPYVSPRSVKKFVVEETIFGREGVLLVVTDADQSKSVLANGQYVLGSSGVTVDQRRQLILPWLLNSNARSVCSLGLATGISASGLESLENPPAITAVELSSKVKRIAKKHFANETNGFFDRTDNHVVIEDARTYMAAANNEFDLIVGDLYRPHGSGEGRLYSVEHFQNVQNALTDDGVFCQWLPVYQLNFENWKTIAATFQSVFPETLIVIGNQNPSFPVIGLIGRKSDQQWQSTELSAQFEDIPAVIANNDPQLNSYRQLVVGVLKKDSYPNEVLNTLDNLKVELSSGNFWTLKDLRRKRSMSFESEFIKGKYFGEFIQRLQADSKPVWSRNRP